MYDDYEPNPEDWLAIRSIADRYCFDRVLARATREVAALQFHIDPVTRVVLAQKYNIPQWLPRAYTELVSADMALTHADADRLGLRVSLMVMRARATWLSETGQYYRRDVEAIVSEEVEIMKTAEL